MSRPNSAWEKPPQPRVSDSPVGLGDPWAARPKAAFPVEVRPSRPFLGRSSSDANGLLIAAIVLSLSLHGMLLGTIVAANVLDDLWGPAKRADEPVMEIIDLADFPSLSKQVKALAVIPGSEAAAPAPTPPPDAKGQLVELAKPDQPQVPREDAKYLSEHDRRADEETVARETALTPGVVADEFKGLGDQPKQGTDRFAGDTKTELAVIGPRRGENGENGELAPAEKSVTEMIDKDPFGILAPRRPEPRRIVGAAGRPGGAIEEAGTGTEVAMAGAPNNDYLPNVRKGDKTQLNAKEFVFASFWHRVQKQVEPFWVKHVRAANPGQIQKRDYMTRVNVVLAPDGSVVAVDIVSGSGVAGWDRAVVAAFQEASPFLNPPQGMIEDDGNIHMGDLGFIVSLTGGQIVHMYGDPRAGKLFPGMREGR